MCFEVRSDAILSVCLSPRHSTSLACGCRWLLAQEGNNIFNKQLQTDGSGPHVGCGLTLQNVQKDVHGII
jgi:hypothetical protein